MRGMLMKKIFSLLLVSIILISISGICFATNDVYISELKMNVSFPDSYRIITRSTPSSDPIWTSTGMDSSSTIAQLESEGCYLMAFSEDWSKMTVVYMSDINTDDDFNCWSNQDIIDTCSLAIEEFEDSSGYSAKKGNVVEKGNAKYFTYTFSAPDVEADCYTYLTLVEGKRITINCASYSGLFSNSELKELDAIVDSIQYTRKNVELQKSAESTSEVKTTTSTNGGSSFLKVAGTALIIIGIIIIFSGRGRSSNGLKASRDVQRIKLYGGTAKISLSQVVIIISNSQDAKRNLSPDEFSQFKIIYDGFRKQKKQVQVDFLGYIGLCEQIISAYEKFFPYMLIDGSHSQNIEIRNQIRIRQLFNDGEKYESALTEYESNYDNIDCEDFDGVNNSYSKLISEITFDFADKFAKKYLQKETPYYDYGFLLGLLDGVFINYASRTNTATTDENNVTLYSIYNLGIKDYSDEDINRIMAERKQVALDIYSKINNKPNKHICDFCEKMLLDKYTPVSNGIASCIPEIRNMLREHIEQIEGTVLLQNTLGK